LFVRSCFTLAAVVVVLVLAPQVASRAQAQATANPEYLPDDDADQDRRAREAFEQGRKAYDDGDYRAAWGHFHRSYELSHRPELLYNIGQTADRLRRDQDAVTAFRQYLEQRPNADNRREVENRLRALEERMQQEGTGAPVTATESEGTPPPPAAEDTAPTPITDQPTRSGWYFRLALGVGARRDGIVDDDNSAFEATMSGVGFSGEFSAGLTLMPGVVVGGGLFVDWTSAPSVETGTATFDLDTANLTMFGPMIDWYLDPQVDGIHFQGALALATLSYSPRGITAGIDNATGAALILGGGYEWPLTEAVAFGALGRVALASVADDPYSHGFFALSALCSLTWY
jgi:hypothetical protein